MSLAEYLEKQRREQAGETASAPSSRNEMPSGPAAASQPSDKATEPGLLLRLWNRKIWVFPWAHFIEAEYFPQREGGADGNFAEQIRMVFASREIILNGRNLAALIESSVRHRVLVIREVPEKFLQANAHDATQSIVVNMAIRARAK
jgi:hypothetical protein